jgi:beta-glucanase (GH16 family)
MENIGREPEWIHATVHGPGYSGDKGITARAGLPAGGRVSDAFHLFRADWSKDKIEFYLDNLPYRAVSRGDIPAGARWVFDHPFFLLLNIAVGGDWPGKPAATTSFPQSMLVDWVRVWQVKPPPGPARAQ